MEIRECSIEVLEEKKTKIAKSFVGKSIKQVFREELVFWETKIKPWCEGEDYYVLLTDILNRAGFNITNEQIGFNLSVVSKEIGFDRKTKKLDGRKAILKKPNVREIGIDILSQFENKPIKNLRVLIESEFDFIENTLLPVLAAHNISQYKFICEEILSKVGLENVNPDTLKSCIHRIRSNRKKMV